MRYFLRSLLGLGVLLSLFLLSSCSKSSDIHLELNPPKLSDFSIWTPPHYSDGPPKWEEREGMLCQVSNVFVGGEKEYQLFEGTRAIYRKPLKLSKFRMKVEFINHDNDGVSVIFWYKTPYDFYRVITVSDPSNKGPFTSLQRRVPSGYQTLETVGVSYKPGEEQEIVIDTTEGDVKVFLNGSLVIRHKSPLSKGTFGIGSYASKGLCFKEIEVETN